MESDGDNIWPQQRPPRGGTCILCGKPFQGWGHDANPLAHGRCCDDCNFKVIDARILALKELHARGVIG